MWYLHILNGSGTRRECIYHIRVYMMAANVSSLLLGFACVCVSPFVGRLHLINRWWDEQPSTALPHVWCAGHDVPECHQREHFTNTEDRNEKAAVFGEGCTRTLSLVTAHHTHTHTAHMKYSSWKVDNWQWRLRVSGSVQPPNEYYVQYLYFTLSIFKCPKYIFCSVCLSVYMTLSLCAVLHCRVLAEMALTSSHYPPDGCFPPSFFVDVTFAVRASRIRETAHFARAQINIKHFE